MNNTPKIRFKGFTEAWEQRKLIEISDIITGTTPPTKDKDNYGGDRLFVSPADIQGNRYIDETITTLTEKGYALGRVLRAGTTLFVSIGSTIGKVAQIKDSATTNQQINAVIPNGEMDDDFVFTMLENEADKIKKLAATQAVPIINKTTFGETEIQFPKKEEQMRIGKFFSDLDNLITLHQRKCDETKELKKYMLQKLFPKNGEQFPEIRFEGFTDAWEQRKLGEIAEKVTTKNTGTQYIETLTNSAEFGIISQRDFFDHDVSNMENIDGYYIVKDDSFVYNPRISTSAPVGPINRNKLGRTGVMSPLYTVFRTHDVDSEYLEWFFKSTRWHAFMKFNGDSGARSDRFSIKDAVFFEMPIPIPDIDEQRKIGKHMTQLDNLITLHQRKCEEIKEIKKFMLKNMFP